jgi:hypothetical protein
MSKKSEQNSGDDKAQRLREYLNEVHRRNEQSREQRERLAGTPEVGLFWIVDGRLIIAGAWIEEATTTGRFAHYPTTDEKEWSLCQRAKGVPRDTKYDDPPRGRVDFDKIAQKFHLYADACILKDDPMIEKIRKDLNLPSEILILPDNFYQCVKCLGLLASAFARPRRHRKPGFAFNQDSFVDSIRPMIIAALRNFYQARFADADGVPDADPLWANEAKRLLDLQLPNWIASAPTNARFSRAKALELAISQIENGATKVWATVVSRHAKGSVSSRSVPHLPDRKELEPAFFSWVRANCATALQGAKARRLPASPEYVFVVWDHVCAALTYMFQMEIATINNYVTHVIWFEDRVDTHLDGRLRDRITIWRRGTKLDLAAVIRAGIDLVPVDRIWSFAVNEIARQVGKPANELLLPKREAIEGAFLRRVDDVYAAALRGERHEMDETQWQ